MEVREFRMTDYDAVVALWQAAGLHLSPSDDRARILHKLERDPDLFLVGAEQGTLVAAVVGGYDGRRGWVYHLAVHPDHQGRGLGAALLAELEERLRRKGCHKLNLLVEPDNASVQRFYQRVGYRRDELIFMEKWLR